MRAIKQLFFLLLIISSCKPELKEPAIQQTETVLIGEIIGRPNSNTLWMVKSYEDFRNDSVLKIPITDCKFNYTFKAKDIESYNLAFEEDVKRGYYRAITVFSEQDTIKMVIHNDEDFDYNTVVGGVVNEEYQNFQKIMRSDYYSRYNAINKKYKSYNYKAFQSQAYIDLMKRLKEAKTQEEKVPLYQKQKQLQEDNLDKSELGKIKEAEYKAINTEMVNYKYNYISKHPTLVSFDLLLEDLIGFEYREVPLDKVLNAYNALKPKFTSHPYSSLGQNLIFGITGLKEGGDYVNFKAPDIKGKKHELKSVLAEHKIVLLDLWATWCGPCIAKTRLVKPVYEKYKDKGFTILGVAGEFKNLERYTKFMAKEQWPWQQLIELDKENKIWEKYSIMNSGGGMFLISSEGKILAVDPSAEELDAILEEKLASNTLKL